jgi:Fe-S oxidoreductase
MLHRKQEALAEALHGERSATILTNCPSCVQGLGRNRPMGVTPMHLVVALAERLSGAGWLERFRAQAAGARAIQF